MNGQELRQILRKMGVKQVDLAAKMGISPQHLTSLLQAASVKISTLERIAQAVGKEVSDLCFCFHSWSNNHAPESNKKGGVPTPSTQR